VSSAVGGAETARFVRLDHRLAVVFAAAVCVTGATLLLSDSASTSLLIYLGLALVGGWSALWSP